MHILILFLIFFTFPVHAADEVFSSSGLALPRFVSLAKQEVNVRAGPGSKYPIKWVYERKGLPVEVVLEYGNWRKIRDYEGQEGWVYHTLLSGRRNAVISSDVPVPLYKKPEKEVAEAFFSPLVVMRLNRCNDSYCQVEKDNYSGWIERKMLWGVYEHEIID